jgi:hypothetical protein
MQRSIIILGTGAEAWQTSYSITDLGTTFVPLDINKKGKKKNPTTSHILRTQ